MADLTVSTEIDTFMGGGPLAMSVAGAASTPALRLTGAPFTGGDATTTKPLVLLEPTGVPSTTWPTAGTMLGINALTGFLGSLIEAQVNGGRVFSVIPNVATGAGIRMGVGPANWDFVSIDKSPVQYIIRLNGRADASVTALGAGQNANMENGAYLDNISVLGWGNNACSGYATDTVLGRLAAANLRLGKAPSATPIAQTLTIGEASRPGTDSNVAGASGTIASGLGTGTGAQSTLAFVTPTTVASGSGVQTYVQRLALGPFWAQFGVGVQIPDTNVFAWSTRARFASPADGIITLNNNANSDFTRLQFGGTTSAFPALRRTGTTLECVLADASSYAPFWSESVKTQLPSINNPGPIWRLGTAAVVTPTSPNRTIEVSIDGTLYYIHAKTTNN